MDAIAIRGQKLAYTDKEIQKLTSDTGCHLSTDSKELRIDELTEGADEDDLDESYTFDQSGEDLMEEATDPTDKKERMKREYLALVVNANRDPIKPGPRAKLTKALEYGEGWKMDDGDFCVMESSTRDKRDVHDSYTKLGSFEELLSNTDKPFDEISPNRIYKRINLVGAGPKVDTESLVIYNCALWFEGSNQPFDSTWLRHKTIVSNLGTDSILPGIHELLLTAKQGEWCEALIRPEAAFGKLGVMPRIPGDATIFCLLEIVRVLSKDKTAILVHGSDQNQSIFEDLYETSDQARTRGNYFFEKGQYKPALQRYKSGIRILEAITYRNQEQETKGHELLVKLFNNTARAANAAKFPRLALAACKRAKEISATPNPKTYWHRTAAWNLMGHYEQAIAVARKALQLFPDEQTRHSFSREVQRLNRVILEREKESDELYRLLGRAVCT